MSDKPNTKSENSVIIEDFSDTPPVNKRFGMNLPNRLTMLRIILVPFFAAFLSIGELIFDVRINYIIALIIFIVASITDFLDGYISREYDLETTFGKFADPLADKILVSAALVCFCYLEIVNPFPVIIILAREFMVSGLRRVVADKGIVVSAGIWGKLKTAFTMVTIIFILVSLIMMDSGNTGLNNTLFLIFTVMIWISVILTVISGLIYLNAYKAHISDM
jgi:CDP-diacylglycerol--glycerol-3-phosphate 3-phosphatidyltransferase